VAAAAVSTGVVGDAAGAGVVLATAFGAAWRRGSAGALAVSAGLSSAGLTSAGFSVGVNSPGRSEADFSIMARSEMPLAFTPGPGTLMTLVGPSPDLTMFFLAPAGATVAEAGASVAGFET
jgi:hypothetical protein